MVLNDFGSPLNSYFFIFVGGAAVMRASVTLFVAAFGFGVPSWHGFSSIWITAVMACRAAAVADRSVMPSFCISSILR